jgi:hypothetical protein
MVDEARRNNMIGSEEAASLTDIPNISQKGTRLGNWLNREQAKELLAVPDRANTEGKARLCHPGVAGRLRPLAERIGRARRRDHPAEGRQMGAGRPRGARAGASAPSPSRSG